MRKITLKLQPLTSESFSPFGDVIEVSGAKHFSINEGTIERYHDLADVDLGSSDDAKALISIASCNTVSHLPYSLPLLERHPLGSQAFIPTDNTPLVVAVAPVGESIDISEIQAFISDGSQGINYKRGVWHMPLIAMNKQQQFIIVDRGGSGNNCDEYRFENTEIQLTQP